MSFDPLKFKTWQIYRPSSADVTIELDSLHKDALSTCPSIRELTKRTGGDLEYQSPMLRTLVVKLRI